MKQSKTTFTKRTIDVDARIDSIIQYLFVVCLAMVLSLVGGTHFYIIGRADMKKVEHKVSYEESMKIENETMTDELPHIVIEPFPESFPEDHIFTTETVEEIVEEVIEEPSYTYIMDLNEKEREILERIVEAEVTGNENGFKNVSRQEVLESKIRVAQVVLERVQSNEFPSTVEKVVFQKTQFSPIGDGRYWKVNICDLTKEAVELALRSDTPKYSKGALFFTRGKKCGARASYLFTDPVGHSFFK